jgi:hypothetical protein
MSRCFFDILNLLDGFTKNESATVAFPQPVFVAEAHSGHDALQQVINRGLIINKPSLLSLSTDRRNENLNLFVLNVAIFTRLWTFAKVEAQCIESHQRGCTVRQVGSDFIAST